jgi:sterol desaturase/sphingolipid hydroxylase (fatty acid hydroxylase superfamily)
MLDNMSINTRFRSHLFLYWTLAFACDCYNKVPLQRTLKLVPRVVSVQLLAVLPMILLLEQVQKAYGGPVAAWEDSVAQQHTVSAVAALLIGEWLVYCVHRTLHHFPCLAYFHQVHHRPMHSAAHALYSSIPEAAILNIGASALPHILIGGHAKLIFAIETMGTVMAILTHAGGSKGWFWSHGHDVHHRSPFYNFSTFLLADYMHGTFRLRKYVKGPERAATSMEDLMQAFVDNRKRMEVETKAGQ